VSDWQQFLDRLPAPAGKPSTRAINALPWDSPAVQYRIIDRYQPLSNRRSR